MTLTIYSSQGLLYSTVFLDTGFWTNDLGQARLAAYCVVNMHTATKLAIFST